MRRFHRLNNLSVAEVELIIGAVSIRLQPFFVAQDSPQNLTEQPSELFCARRIDNLPLTMAAVN